MPYTEKAKKVKRGAEYYEENAERIKKRERDKYARLTPEELAHRRLVQSRHRAKNAERERLRYAELRGELIAAYGGCCECCGESETMFLELDHKNGDGGVHRKQIGRGSKACYAWLKKRGFPRNAYRLLCANCNQGRIRNGGICPHEREAGAVLGANG